MALLLAGRCAFGAESYLDNGVIRLGVDLTKGGSITWLSLSGSTNNIVNDHDLGRQIQQSYYSGPVPYNPFNNAYPTLTNWPWNPIRSGDIYGNRSTLLASSNDGQTLYVKCRPMQYALNNVPGQCTFESWISLTGDVAVVSNRLINARTDTTQQFGAFNQELPALYTVGRLYRLFSYGGNSPFTGDALTNLPPAPPPNWVQWRATEGWAALVDTNDWGLGICHPGVMRFLGGFAGTPGSGGPADDPTGYIAPFAQEVLDTNIEYTYSYSLVLGTLQQIRDWAYAQPRQADCDYRFTCSRAHWYCVNTTDGGWPVTNALHMSLNSGDPQMWSPWCLFSATNVPKLYIRAAYHFANPTGRDVGQLFWETNGSGFSEACSAKFAVTNDGLFHTYELDLGSSNSFQGAITQLRFDPAYNGESGDYADVAAISSSPFAANNLVTPALNITRSDGSLLLDFPTVSAGTAGFLTGTLVYDLQSRTSLTVGTWQGVAGYTNLTGDDSSKRFTNSFTAPAAFYRLRVQYSQAP